MLLRIYRDAYARISNERIFGHRFFEPDVPIRPKMHARRTEAMFPFPMSNEVLRARAPQKFANPH